MVLRMEDLDTQRTSEEFAQVLREDLQWLGLTWDVETPPQSQRSHVYNRYFQMLQDLNLVYPCFCTRSRLHNVNAPHQSDGTYVYDGACRNLSPEQQATFGRPGAWRVMVPEETIALTDYNQGPYCQNLAEACGDFVVRRADGVYVYQLAVTVDDGESGVTEVVRGVDLLGSAPRQMYLQRLFGFEHPAYGHVPMLLSADGRRLSKRDRDMDLGFLRQHISAPALIGALAFAGGLIDRPEPLSAEELAREFRWENLKKDDIRLDFSDLIS